MRTRVLHVVPILEPYGAENTVAYLACESDRRRFEPAVVSLFGASDGGLEDRITNAGVPVFHLNKKPGFDLRMFSRFARVLQDFQPDVVHTHNYVLRTPTCRPCGMAFAYRCIPSKTWRIKKWIAWGARCSGSPSGGALRPLPSLRK